MNSNPTNQLMSTELHSETLTGNLLSSLDKAMQAEVLGKRFIERPLVMATNPHAKMIQDKIMSCGYFDMECGCFIRTKAIAGCAKLGPMGYLCTDGYRKLQINYFVFNQSNVVYLWFTGNFLKTGEEIDHISGDKLNDHPSNLRLVSHSLNTRNAAMRRDNSSGFTGVYYDKNTNTFISSINANKKRRFLGRFPNALTAHLARQAYIEAHPELGFTTRHGF